MTSAQRLGQGTASLGLPRYYLMVEGPLADGTDYLISLRSDRASVVDASPRVVTLGRRP